jgi:hypothetical protein
MAANKRRLLPTQCQFLSKPLIYLEEGGKTESFFPSFLPSSLFFSFFGGTQNIMFDRQVLYHLSHTSSPFSLVIFWIRFHVFTWASQVILVFTPLV